MKKGLLLCLLSLTFSLVTFSSCSKDDDEKQEEVFGHPFLEGTKWRYGSGIFCKEIDFLPLGIMAWDTHFIDSHIMYFKYTFDMDKRPDICILIVGINQNRETKPQHLPLRMEN